MIDCFFLQIIVKADDGDASYISEYCENFREIAEEVAMGQADPSKVPERCQTYFNIHETQWRDTGAEAFREWSILSRQTIQLYGQLEYLPIISTKTRQRNVAHLSAAESQHQID